MRRPLGLAPPPPGSPPAWRRRPPARPLEIRRLEGPRRTRHAGCAAISGRISGATTRTTAPARSSASSLEAATGPRRRPAGRRPASLRKSGASSASSARRGPESDTRPPGAGPPAGAVRLSRRPSCITDGRLSTGPRGHLQPLPAGSAITDGLPYPDPRPPGARPCPTTSTSIPTSPGTPPTTSPSCPPARPAGWAGPSAPRSSRRRAPPPSACTPACSPTPPTAR